MADSHALWFLHIHTGHNSHGSQSTLKQPYGWGAIAGAAFARVEVAGQPRDRGTSIVGMKIAL